MLTERLYNALERRRSGILTKLAVAETEVSVAETEVSVAETEVSVAETEVSVAETEVSAAETEVSAAETEVSAAESEVSAAETEVSAAETEVSAAETEVSVIEIRSAFNHRRVSRFGKPVFFTAIYNTDTLVSPAGRFPLLRLVRDLLPLDNIHAGQTKKPTPNGSWGRLL